MTREADCAALVDDVREALRPHRHPAQQRRHRRRRRRADARHRRGLGPDPRREPQERDLPVQARPARHARAGGRRDHNVSSIAAVCSTGMVAYKTSKAGSTPTRRRSRSATRSTASARTRSCPGSWTRRWRSRASLGELGIAKEADRAARRAGAARRAHGHGLGRGLRGASFWPPTRRASSRACCCPSTADRARASADALAHRAVRAQRARRRASRPARSTGASPTSGSRPRAARRFRARARRRGRRARRAGIRSRGCRARESSGSR